jgi:hypothetical protein
MVTGVPILTVIEQPATDMMIPFLHDPTVK